MIRENYKKIVVTVERKYIKYVIIKKTLKMSMKGGTMYRGEKPKKGDVVKIIAYKHDGSIHRILAQECCTRSGWTSSDFSKQQNSCDRKWWKNMGYKRDSTSFISIMNVGLI